MNRKIRFLPCVEPRCLVCNRFSVKNESMICIRCGERLLFFSEPNANREALRHVLFVCSGYRKPSPIVWTSNPGSPLDDMRRFKARWLKLAGSPTSSSRKWRYLPDDIT